MKEWQYKYHFLKQFDWFKPLVSVALISDAIIALAMFIGSPENFFYTLKEMAFVFYMINGIFLLSALITLLFYKGGYTYLYQIKDGELTTRNRPLTLNHEMQVDLKVGSRIELKTVTKLKADRKKRRIDIRGPLTLTTVYAEREDFDDVLSLLRVFCVKARIEEK